MQKEAEFIARATSRRLGTPTRSTRRRSPTPRTGQRSARSGRRQLRRQTLSNIRLLDPNVVRPAFAQRNRLRNFYGFPSQLAIDRYKVDGQSRDFIVAARELDPARLSGNQRDWINSHTVFTTATASSPRKPTPLTPAASTADSDSGGLPVFHVSDLETIRSPDYAKNAPIRVTQPRIYFGEAHRQTAARLRDRRFGQRPQGYDEGARPTPTPVGRVSPWATGSSRLLYSIKYAERNILLRR